MAAALAGAGEQEEALERSAEAVALLGPHAQPRQDTDLARALTVYSDCLAQAGRDEDALAAMREAVLRYGPYRPFYFSRYGSERSASLERHSAVTALASRLYAVGRTDEANRAMLDPFRFMALPHGDTGFFDVRGVQRRAHQWVETGGWQTLLRFRRTKTGGRFQEPLGTEIRVRYGLPRFGLDRQVQHLDGTEKRVWVRLGPPLFAYLQVKVPYSGHFTWAYIGAPGRVPDSGPVRATHVSHAAFARRRRTGFVRCRRSRRRSFAPAVTEVGRRATSSTVVLRVPRRPRAGRRRASGGGP
jgi:hypothetical protein